MKPFVRYIGVVEENNRNHSVDFKQGLNVVTGKSSTGKSALIEIYDYCFGSSDFTVPVGTITEHADLYYVVFQRESMLLVLGRKPKSNKAFIKEVDEIPLVEGKPSFDLAWFDEAYFLVLDNFKKELGFYFGLSIDDISLDDDEKIYRGRKKSSPSIRSFTSFNLQHQNLIANKHALFYRFEQKEKREQAIEHIKVFLGFVDQKYFSKNQELNALEKKKRVLESVMPKKAMLLERKKSELKKRLDEYNALTGKNLINVNLELLINNPAKWLDLIKEMQVEIDSGSDANHQILLTLERNRKLKSTELRRQEEILRGIHASIAANESYFSSIENLSYPTSIDEKKSVCPMCESKSDNLSQEANMLEEAVKWLNTELSKSEPLRYSYESRRKELQESVDQIRSELRGLDSEIGKVKTYNEEARKRNSQIEQAIKVKLFVELYLEELIQQSNVENKDTELEDVKLRIKNLRKELNSYPVEELMHSAEQYLNETINKISENLDFEESFSEPNLKFSFETFDLWYQKGNDKVFLRSMGSGANWLYCHLSLFLGFIKLFCHYKDSCVIPPVLFIDQPSQVYFPNVTNDSDEEFNPTTTANKERIKSIDEDMQSVQKFFDEMVRFCETTEEDTGILPQLIVTDHADHLSLSNERSFESYVRARWRTHGFIETN